MPKYLSKDSSWLHLEKIKRNKTNLSNEEPLWNVYGFLAHSVVKIKKVRNALIWVKNPTQSKKEEIKPIKAVAFMPKESTQVLE